MTQDRTETVPSLGRGLFVSGVVLGLSLGVAASHLLLFARGTGPLEATGQEDAVRPFEPGWPFVGDTGPLDVPADVTFSMMEIGDAPDIGHVRLSDEPEEEPIQYFPEAMSQPDEPAATWQAAVSRPTPDPSLRVTADASIEGDDVPQALSPSPAAAPIDDRTSQREELARSIIKEELPDATAQEREVWYDVLRGLPAEDIKGILRMRKHIGADGSMLGAIAGTPAPLIAPKSAETLTSPEPGTERAGEVEVSRRLAEIKRYNDSNRRTVGFKQLVPVLVESPEEAAGVQLAKVIRDLRSGQLEATGRTFDVALRGPGFLQVRQGEQVRYTRDGRLTRNADGQLMLLATPTGWFIDPPLEIPLEASDVEIAADGRVTARLPGEADSTELGTIRVVQFPDPDALRVDAQGLWEATPQAGRGQAVASADGVAAELLLQGHLERSNVAPGH